MPDTKISAMPPASFVTAADYFPIVQSGVNLRCTRNQILRGHTGEAIALVTNSGFDAGYDSADNYQINVAPAGTCDIVAAASAIVAITGAGACTIGAASGQILELLNSNGSFIRLDADGTITLDTSVPAKVLHLYYTPGTPGDWAGSPTSVWEALDRIAAVVSSGGASPIP